MLEPYFDYRRIVVNPDFFEGRRVLVLGASGLIGSGVVTALESIMGDSIGGSIVAAGRNTGRLLHSFEGHTNVECRRIDVDDSLPELGRFDVIINAAAGADPSSFAVHPVDVMNANMNGVHHILSYAAGHGRPLVLQISTGEVYGYFDTRIMAKEDDQGYLALSDPRSCYPVSKRAAETLCASYSNQYGLDVRIARPSHVFGPGFTESDSRVSAEFFRSALAGRDIVLQSAGTQKRTYVYVDDCVSGLLSIISGGEPCTTYNVTNSRNSVTLAGFAGQIAADAGIRVRYTTPDSQSTAREKPTYKIAELDDTRLRTLGWQPHTSLQQGIHNTLDALRH